MPCGAVQDLSLIHIYDVINDRRADDGRAEEALQVTKLLQRCPCDGNAGGCHDGADEPVYYTHLVKYRAYEPTGREIKLDV